MAKLKFDDIEEVITQDVNNNETTEITLGTIVYIPIDKIDIGENIRNVNDDDEAKLRQLGESIQSGGQIEPCIVYQVNERYVLKAGSRRYKACLLCDIPTLKCIIEESFKDEKERIIYQATENEHRDDMNPRERETYMSRLMELGMSQVDIAKALHKSKGWVSEALTAHNLLQNNKDLNDIIDEDTSTRDLWQLSRLENEELNDLKEAVKNKGGTKKAFKEELNKKIKPKKEIEKEEIIENEESFEIDEKKENDDMNIDFSIEENFDENENIEDNNTDEQEEKVEEIHIKFRVDENIKKAVYEGNLCVTDSDFEEFIVTQAKNYYIGKGYIVD